MRQSRHRKDPEVGATWEKSRHAGVAGVERGSEEEPERRSERLWEPYHRMPGSQKGFGFYST